MIKPIIILKIVDLPTPLGPNNPRISPLFKLKFKSSSIFLLPKWANEAAMDLIQKFESPDEAESELLGMLQRKEKIIY